MNNFGMTVKLLRDIWRRLVVASRYANGELVIWLNMNFSDRILQVTKYGLVYVLVNQLKR